MSKDPTIITAKQLARLQEKLEERWQKYVEKSKRLENKKKKQDVWKEPLKK